MDDLAPACIPGENGIDLASDMVVVVRSFVRSLIITRKGYHTVSFRYTERTERTTANKGSIYALATTASQHDTTRHDATQHGKNHLHLGTGPSSSMKKQEWSSSPVSVMPITSPAPVRPAARMGVSSGAPPSM